jgi:hypothetical protein
MPSINEFSTSIPRFFRVDNSWIFHFHQRPLIGRVEWKAIHTQKEVVKMSTF